MLHWGRHYVRGIQSNVAIVAMQPVTNKSVEVNHLPLEALCRLGAPKVRELHQLNSQAW